MRYLILSDIHANWEGLETVLRHAEGQYDEILCGGDLVGYCADPNAVVDWARRHVTAVVRGNHDKACTGLDDLDWFNPVARAAALWTQAQLTPENLEYLRKLPRGPLRVGQFQLLHGSPLDEDEYLINSHDVRQIGSYVECPLAFFGHTHVQGGFFWHSNGVKRIKQTPPDQEEQTVELLTDMVCLANPGSVGQPRDGDPRAAYLLYCPDEPVLVYRRVAYDVEKAQEKIRKAGLPEPLAARLAAGG
jgi:diadenosine tetraphosphatase ApaH/serine/threonine PP2A family protein phosphatase